MLRNPSRTFFYFLEQIRKLSLNIGGYLPNSDYAKIRVTEKSCDFVTFLHNKILFAKCSIQSNHLKNKNSMTFTISEKESCMDGLWECHLIGYISKGYVIIMRHYYFENVLQISVSDNLQKGKLRHRITQFENFYNCNKIRMNTDCDRAESRFTNDTQCVKKCNIFNIMNINYNLCEY